jgi:GT2 family glycosyltransferase
MCTNYTGNIIVVDDGSEEKEHLSWLKEQYGNVIKIHEVKNNLGIASIKNISLKEAFEENNSDVCFLSDDDMFFKDKNWYDNYIDGLIKTGLTMFSFACSHTQLKARNHSNVVKINGHDVLKTLEVNGCFLTIHKKAFVEVGYFRIPPYNYGHEHTQYHKRVNTKFGYDGYYDLVDSYKWMDVAENSDHSVDFTGEELQENFSFLHHNISIKEEFNVKQN